MRRLLTALLLLAPLGAYAQTSTKGVNFVNQAANPCGAGTSCMWIDTTNKQVQFYDGTTAKTMPSIVTSTKGDIAVFNGTTWVKLTVGANTTVLSADSTTASGLVWRALSAILGNFVFSGNSMDLSGAAVMSIAPTTASAITLGQNTSLASGKTLTVQANVDGSGVGPVIISSTSNPTIGVAVTLDATSDAGGHKYSVLSTGTNAGVGPATLSVFDATSTTYRFVVDATGISPGVAYTSNSGTSTRPWNEENLHHLVGHSTTKPSCAPDTGAGGGATCSTLTGSTDIAGTLEIDTGLAPAATAIIATITFYTAYNAAPRCAIWPANLAAQAMMANSPFVTSAPTTLSINSGAVAVTASGTLQYTYHCIE